MRFVAPMPGTIALRRAAIKRQRRAKAEAKASTSGSPQ